MTTRQSLRSSSAGQQRAGKPTAIDRFFLRWLGTSHDIDGLWVGTTESKPYPALRRVEKALLLLKTRSPFHYGRVTRHLTRIWVHLVPSSDACYERSLNACVFDERFLLRETTTPEEIASVIVHETTHARLERWGINYIEKDRSRIEAICLRRELNFLAGVPGSEALQDEKARTLEWCDSEPDYFLDSSFQKQRQVGEAETLRYLNVPEWLIGSLLRAKAVRSRLHRFIHARPA